MLFGLPDDHDLPNPLSNRFASEIAIPAGHQISVIARVSVTDVGSDGQIHGLGRETLGRCRSSYAPAVLPAGMLGYRRCEVARAARVASSDCACELLDVLELTALSVLASALAARRSLPRVGGAPRLGSLKRRLFHQGPLTLVSLTTAAPLNDNGSESRMLARSTRQRSVTSWQIDEVAKVCAVETPRGSFGNVDEPAGRELVTAVRAGRVAPHPKDDDVLLLGFAV